MRGHIQRLEYEGYLSADGELKYFASGNPVYSFRMGSTRRYNDPKTNEEVKETTWLNCSITRKAWAEALAEQKLEKGSHVIVFGRIRVNEFGAPRTYQRKDGGWSASLDITVDDMQILRWGGRDTNGGDSSGGYDTADEEQLPY